MNNITIAIGIGGLRSDARGFSRLGQLHQELATHSNSLIAINLSNVDWFDGHMAAPMRVVIRAAEARGNRVRIIRPRPNVETILRKNGFLPSPINDYHNTTMPIIDFILDDGVAFASYVKKHFGRREMPRMSEALKGKFFEGIDEIFANSALHSKSECGLSACGQFYPRQARLDFTMADGGRGIPTVVRSSGKFRPRNDPHAIEWAMEDYNTTRQLDIPGGLGSKILRDFIRLNGGKLSIASNGGFWSQSGSEVQVSRLTHAFPGTAVLLEINTADQGLYDLVDAPHPRDIW